MIRRRNSYTAEHQVSQPRSNNDQPLQDMVSMDGVESCTLDDRDSGRNGAHGKQAAPSEAHPRRQRHRAEPYPRHHRRRREYRRRRYIKQHCTECRIGWSADSCRILKTITYRPCAYGDADKILPEAHGRVRPRCPTIDMTFVVGPTAGSEVTGRGSLCVCSVSTSRKHMTLSAAPSCESSSSVSTHHLS